MRRRWKQGAATAIIIGVLTALTVAMGAAEERWRLGLHVSAEGVEISAARENVRIALTL